MKEKIFSSGQKTIYLSLVLAVFAAGAFLRYAGMPDRGLEYDEIWTAQYYSSGTVYKIFTDTATPNNHPLHSFLIKLLFPVFGVSSFSLRLPAFVSGIALLPLVFVLARLIFRQKSIALLAFSFVAFNGMLIHYSQTARGYSVQTFLISLFILSVVYFERNREKMRHFKCCCMGFFVIPALAILCLPTSIMFILPLIAAHCIYLLMKETNRPSELFSGIFRTFSKNRGTIASYGLLGIFTLAWYLINLDKYSAGKSFGMKIDSAKTFFDFFREAFMGPSGLYFFAGSFLILIRRKHWKYLMCWLALMASVMIFALLFNGGPSRAYTPLVPVATIACAAGLETLFTCIRWRTGLKRLGLPLMIAAMLLSFFYGRGQLSDLTPTDWSKTVPLIMAKYPKSYYISYPAGDAYPVKFNNYPDVMTDNFQRTTTGSLKYIVQIERGKTLSGVDPSSGSEINIPLSADIVPLIEKTAGLECCVCGLEAITPATLPGDIKSRMIIATIGPADKNTILGIKKAICLRYTGTRWVLLNAWLRRLSDTGPEWISTLCAQSCPCSLEEILKIQKNSNGLVRFYIIKSFSEEKSR